MPLAWAVGAAFALDLLWPILLLLGLETVRVHPGDTAFTSLAFDSYPWSHSLLLAAVWSVLAGVAARGRLGTSRAGVIVAALVLSHWLLDLVAHRQDLPLWPSGPVVGLGLWRSIPATLAVEGTLLAGGLAAYLRATSPRDSIGRWALVSLITLATAIWVAQPWSPPPPSATAVAIGALALWLFLPWSRWIEGHRR